jgi:glycosyltransferase involved in cell wall biosynthesis
VAQTDIGPFRAVPPAAAQRWSAGDPASLAAALARLADSDRRRATARAGLAYARTLTLDAVLDRLEAALRLEGVPAPPRRAAAVGAAASD